VKLITEVTEEIKIEILEEGTGGHGPKSYYIEGVMMQAGIPNKNHRIYPVGTLKKEIDRYVEENVKTGSAFGELGHPDKPSINLDRVSHMIKSIRQEGNNFIGRAKVLTEMPMGKMVKTLIDEGARLGVSSRGLGTLKEIKGGVMEVQDDFRLAAGADIVADPSAPDAFVRGIMENVDWIYDAAKGTWIQEQVQPMVEKVKQKTQAERERDKLRLFEWYVDGLSRR